MIGIRTSQRSRDAFLFPIIHPFTRAFGAASHLSFDAVSVPSRSLQSNPREPRKSASREVLL
jgi:hypothetical protein